MKREENMFFDELRKLASRTERIYIYGAGLFGRNIYNLIQQKGISVAGFIVTKKSGDNEINNIPIVEAKDVLGDNIGIIIGVNRRNEIDVRNYLQRSSFNMERVINGNGLMDNDGNREGYDGSPVIEITTKIGCKINCRYCPQTKLITEYFQHNSKRPDNMDYQLFIRCIQNMPENTLIRFCGMSEPFLNPDCMKMIQYSCEIGRDVDLFTTLVGLDIKDLDALIKLPIEWVNIHVADKRGYANIPLTEEYFEVLSRLVDAKKADGTPFINVISAQAEPDERVSEICQDKFAIYSTLTNRAGNLEGSELLAKSEIKGKISCSMCGRDLNNNVLLPDGTLLLCCMDYGMKHVLGNLKEQSYEEIMNGNERRQIKRGMELDFEKDILCRRCAYANLID